MIRKIKDVSITDIDAIMTIWLNVNIETHEFIDKSYWIKQYASVEQAIQKATLIAYYEETKIVGFIGLVDNYIAGLFVGKKHQNQGIGSKLLSFVKAENDFLSLTVYCKNQQAIRFYLKQGFKISTIQLDELTQEQEYVIAWNKALIKEN